VACVAIAIAVNVVFFSPKPSKTQISGACTFCVALGLAGAVDAGLDAFCRLGNSKQSSPEQVPWANFMV
jgi:hypothetical protein